MSAKKPTKSTPSLADKATDAIDGARERAITAYDSARDNAAAAGKKASDQLGEAPLAVIAGGAPPKTQEAPPWIVSDLPAIVRCSV